MVGEGESPEGFEGGEGGINQGWRRWTRARNPEGIGVGSSSCGQVRLGFFAVPVLSHQNPVEGNGLSGVNIYREATGYFLF